MDSYQPPTIPVSEDTFKLLVRVLYDQDNVEEVATKGEWFYLEKGRFRFGWDECEKPNFRAYRNQHGPTIQLAFHKVSNPCPNHNHSYEELLSAVTKLVEEYERHDTLINKLVADVDKTTNRVGKLEDRGNLDEDITCDCCSRCVY